METKSRYEVIFELEGKKRSLIQERDNLNNDLKAKEKELKIAERNKSDEIILWDRKIEDMKDDVENFKSTIDERKETLKELIKSVDDSLERFNNLNSQKK